MAVALGAGVLATLLGPATPALGRARPTAGPRKAAKCDSRRYGCVGQKPQDYDKDVRVTWKPPPGADRVCLARLRAAKVSFRMLRGVKGVRTPVEVLSPRLGGVAYRRAWNNKRRFILDCHMVEVLVLSGRKIRRAGVASLYYSSTWRYTMIRGQGRLSQHASGNALDVVAIDGAFGYASVVRHYERGVWGCGSRNKTPKGAAWRKLLCALQARRAFGQIFTPDTDRDHRDHFHVEQPSPGLRLEPRPARPVAGGRGRRPVGRSPR